MKISPLIQTDMYKLNHYNMYPDNTTKIYSNLTPRKSRLPGINKVVVFGIQYFVLEYLISQWNENFFKSWDRFKITVPDEYGDRYTPEQIKGQLEYERELVIKKYKRMMDNTLGKDSIDTSHIEKLWDLGYLPLEIKALPEGTLCPIGVPCLTITNTVDHAYWLVNYLETIMSCTVWQPITSATIAYEYRKLLNAFAIETTGSTQGVEWQGHDFSMRGMSSLESACTSGAGHLLSFRGTDTIPAIEFLESYYSANVEKELVGSSVPATEHSVMCMGSKDDELGTFRRLLNKYPKGILSVVSDTWNLWKVCTEYLPTLKADILARNGKLVIRPDSGNPVDIICGLSKDNELFRWQKMISKEEFEGKFPNFKNEEKGVIELLWDIFGGTINDRGYKVLDSHIGAIYGDSITIDRARQICERLKDKGFASTNIVLGIGSYTYQYNTRDTFGFAVKATAGKVGEEFMEIFKDPITDDGTKKSKKGLLQVCKSDQDNSIMGWKEGDIVVEDQCTWEQEKKGLLETVFLNGKLIKNQTLSEIRERLNNQI